MTTRTRDLEVAPDDATWLDDEEERRAELVDTLVFLTQTDERRTKDDEPVTLDAEGWSW